MSVRPSLHSHKRVVIKIGSNVIASRAAGLNEARMQAIATEIAALRAMRRQVFVVSSGAVLSGMGPLGLSKRPGTLNLKQAAAAVGQSRLMWAYERCFSRHDITVAQVLLTREDVADRTRFINARNTLMTLLDYDALPIINENDTVAVEEMKLGDNDHLAALVAHLVDATLLILLSDVDGLYTADPRQTPSATRVSQVRRITEAIERMAGGTGDLGGTGGMASKVRAAKNGVACGVATLILGGGTHDAIRRAFDGEDIGTLFLPKVTRRSLKKQWIAQRATRGDVTLDAGAVAAILHKGKSLLPSGIQSVRGAFKAGDAVRCLAPDGAEIARGLTNYNASELRQIAGARSSEIAARLGHTADAEAIHRNNMVIHDTASDP